MKICFISRYDSFVKLAQNYALEFRRHNWDVTFSILDRSKLSKSQVSILEQELSYNEIGLKTYKKKLFLENDVVFFCLTGGYIKKIIKTLNSDNKNVRPYLVAAYPGIIYQNIYDGFASRSLCDLIVFPSSKEKKEYDEFCKKYHLINIGVVGGYFSGKKYNGNDFSNDAIFAEQSVVPSTISDRLYLAKKLIEFAEKNPNKKLFVKPRNYRSDKSLFETKLHILDALNLIKNKNLPKNLIITYNPIEFYTSQGALCITISSTAAIETLQFHEKIAIISDFGPSENNGGTYFLDSNLQYTFSELISGVRKNINKDWKHQVYISNESCINTLIDRVIKDIKDGKKPGIINKKFLFSDEYINEKNIRLKKWFLAFRFFRSFFQIKHK